MAAEGFVEALASLRAGVDALVSADIGGLEKGEPVEAVRGVETERRRLAAVDARLLAQVAETSLAAACWAARPGGRVGVVLRLDPRPARRRVARAERLGPRPLLGEPLAPLLPVRADAVAAGCVSGEQVDVILDTLDQLPPAAPARAGELVGLVLVAAAAEQPPRALRRTGAAGAAPDRHRGRCAGPAPSCWPAWPRTGSNRPTKRPAGCGRSPCSCTPTAARARGAGSTPRPFDAETTACWQAILDALAAPHPDGDGVPDPRSAAQRRHDATTPSARPPGGCCARARCRPPVGYRSPCWPPSRSRI